MHNHLALFQPITERFDFVCDSKGEVKICQRHADARAVTNETQEPGNIEARADVEVRPIIAPEKLKQIATGPIRYIQILSHRGNCNRLHGQSERVKID